MFTLRLEWQRRGESEHSMHECREYQVQREAGRTIVTLDPNGSDPRELIVDSAAVIYVMNSSGQTVDTIRIQHSAFKSPDARSKQHAKERDSAVSAT